MSRYDNILKYIDLLKDDSVGKWHFDEEHKGTEDDPIHMAYVQYTQIVREFIGEIFKFHENNPDFELANYKSILAKRGIKKVNNPDVSDMDAQGVMALLMSIARGERFCDGLILVYIKNGTVMKWLLRLKEIRDLEEKV